ncbi:NUDIX domain-containing protein [Bacillus pseudomycoides]|uniref:NUDIX domain-containing protein n=1 Tax=Bacillus pseudomycoides TaxID=64104 RepID=UPI000BEF2F4C|nr:NUDIX domain-containing protein [Bacillus pseudomycoides]PEI90278.1 hypothetical protein CN686_24405 [Bacillus pseudomycoides]PEM77258.1 hypothetical protein CN619_05630 [Bacillus pseudomycoides]PGA60038.1 hypothetical protein COL84_23895 [Bacillus pseudomycoides]PGC24396.1 hypothetical protein COM11_24780 [Bacillus pseudomycoides]PHA47312.1 hypothetical protein COE73_19680 [Bacillus pseudomycoides]
MNYHIRVRAGAVIIENDSILLIEFHDENGLHYNLPAGGVGPNETVIDAVQREVKEDDLLFIRECFMNPEIHRVEFMYSCTPVSFTNVNSKILLHMDSKQTGISWLPIDDLLHSPLFPIGIRKLIKDFHTGDHSSPVYIGEID